jgi:cytochrome c oxidase assembly protein subunit 15
VQFNHRICGYLVFAAGLAVAVVAGRARHLPERFRVLAVMLGVLVTLQAGLGISTLMAHAPLALSIVHQSGAAILLAAAVTFAWRAQRI